MSVHELNEIANTELGGRVGLTVTDYDPDSGALSASWVLIPNVLDAAGNVHHGAISSVVETIASIGAGATVKQSPLVDEGLPHQSRRTSAAGGGPHRGQR